MVTCAAFLPDRQRAVSCGNDREIRLWDVETCRQLNRFQGSSHNLDYVAASPDGRHLISSSYEGCELLLWDLKSSEPVQTISLVNDHPFQGSFTPDGRQVVWGSTNAAIRRYRLASPGPEKARRTEVLPAQPIGGRPALVEEAPIRGQDGAILSAAVSPDGRRVLSGTQEKAMILWDRETGRPNRRFKPHNDRVMTVAISPDGRRALSGSADKMVRLWDLEKEDPIHEFTGLSEWVFSVAFSPDGKLIYASSGGHDDGGWRDGKDSAIRVWDVESG
jgi:Tol biopolymer transport system component